MIIFICKIYIKRSICIFIVLVVFLHAYFNMVLSILNRNSSNIMLFSMINRCLFYAKIYWIGVQMMWHLNPFLFPFVNKLWWSILIHYANLVWKDHVIFTRSLGGPHKNRPKTWPKSRILNFKAQTYFTIFQYYFKLLK